MRRLLPAVAMVQVCIGFSAVAQQTAAPPSTPGQGSSVSHARFLAESFTEANAGESSSSSTAAPSPDLFTGGLSSIIPLEIPSGRHGLQPILALIYRNGNPNGWLGMGWCLNLGVIHRNGREGLDYSGDKFVYESGGSSVDLVKTNGGEYRSEN
jgi:hypothetical protein